jgi:hypothetical protein
LATTTTSERSDAWAVFRQLVKRAFCTKNKNTQIKHDVPLDTPLGGWYRTTRNIHYDEYRTRTKLFRRDGDVFQRFAESENTNYLTNDGDCTKLPLAAHPTESTLTLRGRIQMSLPYDSIIISTEEPPDPSKLSENDPEHIYNATNIIAASDSSVDPITGEATYNWRITTYDKRGLITKSSFVNSNPAYMNSYRGEMAGLQDLITWVHSTELRKKVLKIVCDNKGCVDVLQNQHISLVDLDKAESDLIQDIKKKLKDFDDTLIEWVRGHQDDDELYDDLSIEAQLNVDCDRAAKLHLKEGTRPTYAAKPIVGSKATLYLGGYIVTTEINEQIKMAARSKQMLAYAADKFGWTDNQASNTINW